MVMIERQRAVLGSHYWPYGAHEEVVQERLLQWAIARKLRYSPRGECLHWIARGRCAVADCYSDGRGAHSWMDHVTGWIRDGHAAMLLCQPYDLSPDQMVDLVAVAEKWSLNVRVNGCGWYGNGTVAIELTPLKQKDTPLW